MAKKPPADYWDACVFLAWLNAEDCHGASVLEGIREMVRDVDAGRIRLFTSVLTKTEIFHRLKSQWAKEEYTRFLQRPNATPVAQDERISDKSSEIREYYSRKGITLDVGDCVHLATAILYKADTFYTLDGHSRAPKAHALLRLDGNVAEYPLRIRVPHAPQGNLFGNIPHQAVSSAIVSPKPTLTVVASNPTKQAKKQT